MQHTTQKPKPKNPPTKKKPTQHMFVEDDELDGEQDSQEEVQYKPEVETRAGSGSHNILQLPSNGQLWYPASVEYRDIMAKDEEVLATATPETYARTLNGVLKSILNDCSFFEELTVFDRDYILVWLWANNYTATKQVDVTCRHCDHQEAHTVDLTAVPVTDVKANLPVPFTMPLSKSDVKSVNLRLNTVGDELLIEEYTATNKNANFEHLMLACSIDLGFKMPLKQKLTWIGNNITAREMGHIRNFHRYFRYGVNDTIEHTCSECKGVTRGQLPFQAEDVLYPTVQSDFEELLRSQ